MVVIAENQFTMPELAKTTDHLCRKFSFRKPPERIVSLVPSISELIWDLGMEKELVGITRFCVNPREMFKTKTRVGGTKEIKMDRLNKASPDLIVANKEENTREMVGELEKQYPVYVTDVCDFESALKMIEDVAALCNKEKKGFAISKKIREECDYYKSDFKFGKQSGPRVAYLIWKDPWMTVGGDTFVSEMLRLAGFENVFGNQKRYPETSLEELRAMQTDYLFLSSEPFPFREKHVVEIQETLPDTRIELVDGEMFSWYGTRLLRSFDYFRNLKNRLSF